MFNRLSSLTNKIRMRHILVLALLLRLAWYLFIRFTHPEGFWLYDSNEYWNIAYNLHEYGVFSRNAEPPLLPDYFRTPLYPLFIFPTIPLDATGNTIPPLQIVVDLVSCWLIYKIVYRLTGSGLYAKAGAFLYAIHLPALFMTSFVLSESVFLFLLTWFTWSLLRCMDHFNVRRVFILGLVGGLCVMCKPVAFVLVFPTLVFILYMKKINARTLTLCLCFTATFYAVQFPWMYRNKQVYGHYFNSILGEHLLFGYHACHIYSLAHHIDYFETKEMLLDKFYRNISFNPYEQPYEYAKLIEQESYKILWENKGLFLREHIKECLKFFVQPMRTYVAHQLGPYTYTRSVVTLAVVWQVLAQAFFYLAVLYYLLLVLLRKRRIQFFVFFLLLLVLVFCQFNTMPYTDARMRFPFDGILVTMAVYAVYAIRRQPVQTTVKYR